ncbi:hypothetical protein ACFPA8_11355 [Streptomyces ovatisporus]|uniref:Type VI secretion protein n=1 Tax=Streptomyces ovatisporus TaxID=1128682 RepID=A0ABV9A859_9ACTN
MPQEYGPDHGRPHDGHPSPVRRSRGVPGPGSGSGSGSGGGIPDGLLVGVLALLLAVTVLVWTATGLAGMLAHGSWPQGVTFVRTPMAIRDLAAAPQDLAGAWPHVNASQLPGHGLFWGVFIGQLMVALVLTVFTVGTVTRARAVRAARRYHRSAAPTDDKPQQPQAGGPTEVTTATPDLSKPPGHTPAQLPPDATDPGPAAEPRTGHSVTQPQPHAPPASLASAPEGPPALLNAEPNTAGAGTDPHSRIVDAPGAALVATTDPVLWAATKDARAKLGPVHLFDPGQLCDTPDRLRWSPHHGCADKDAAAARATALLAPLRSPRPIDAEVHAAAETLLRCWLHAAALDDRPFREVHRWALAKTAPTDPVHTLRTHPKAAAGSAGELEATLTGHPERRREATELIRRALAPLSQLHVRNACTAARADRLALESFIDETGTLYVVGDDPELMPLLNALTQSVVEHGRRMAVRSSPGRLDPPLTTVFELPLDGAGLPLPGGRPQPSG